VYLDFSTGFDFPPYWLNRPVVAIGRDDDSDFDQPEKYLGNLYQDSLRMRFENDAEWFTFPYDPVISISGKNNIVRRSILKGTDEIIRRGTVKELWSQDDYEVNIAGVFMGDGELPETYLRKLRDFCEAGQIVEVESVLFSIFGITRLAIEDYALPFTKGVENQQYTIKGYSDDLFELMVKESDK
jgi:hypothetical protein